MKPDFFNNKFIFCLFFPLLWSSCAPSFLPSGRALDKKASSSAGNIFNIRDFGARGDSSTLNTHSIQQAIDAAAAAGGGRVLIPNGVFISGTLYLKSGVDLHLKEGAKLLGSVNWLDYAKTTRWYSLILGNDLQNVSISGQGTIDGNCTALIEDIKSKINQGVIDTKYFSRNRPSESIRPQLIELTHCDGYKISGVTLQNAAGWTETYKECTNLLAENFKVRSFLYWTTDGIDLIDCQHAVVRHMDIECEDDGICLKSESRTSACENIEITDCRISSGSSAFKFGTPSTGGFKNIVVRNLEIYNTDRSAIALEMVDGGLMENIDISQVHAVNTTGSLFIRLGRRNQNRPPGIIRGLYLHDITLEAPAKDARYYLVKYDGPPPSGGPAIPHNSYPAMIVGIPEQSATDIRLENFSFVLPGAGLKSKAYIAEDALDQVPEKVTDYPENNMFGELPAAGLYIRHAQNIRLKNVTMSLRKSDQRPLIVADDVKVLKFKDFKVSSVENQTFWFRHVEGSLLKGIPNEIKVKELE